MAKLCACVRQSCCTQFEVYGGVGNEIRDDTRAQKALFVRQLDHVGDVGRAWERRVELSGVAGCFHTSTSLMLSVVW
jgi:hypothetical protein